MIDQMYDRSSSATYSNMSETSFCSETLAIFLTICLFFCKTLSILAKTMTKDRNLKNPY